jgi:hypothetical protein
MQERPPKSPARNRVLDAALTVLYPRVATRRLPAMLAIACSGAVMAAVYGAVHDQISYSISPEYFTKMKFQQFRWADAGWPPRVFASVVGVLATWWAGLFAGWFLARAGLDQLPPVQRRATAVRAFALMLGVAVTFGILGALCGRVTSDNKYADWEDWRERLALEDVAGFATVAWLHAAGYVGALVGLIAAIIYVRKQLKAMHASRTLTQTL